MEQYRIEDNKRCFSDVPGAVFVSWDSDSSRIEVRVAIDGLKKVKGCVEYYQCKGVDPTCFWLYTHECNKLYYDHPKREEAWLVLPDGTGYEWIRIDNLIDFS